MAHILIVHAHPEPQSFSSSLAHTYRDRLLAEGHTVDFKDLYALGFQPVSDRRNFQQAVDADYYKQQAEERHATEVNGFAPDLEAHMQDLERCDALVFSFPLWWFSMPAILKGWVDRVFAMGRIYGGPKLYENGLGQARRPARILLTTGGPPEHYDSLGLNPPMSSILATIEHGIFWFNGFLPLPATVAYGPARWTPEQRTAFLQQASEEASNLMQQPPSILPRMEQFEGGLTDRHLRTRVELRGAQDALPADALRELQRIGILTDLRISTTPEWIAYLDLRTPALGDVEPILQNLALPPAAEWTIRPLQAKILNGAADRRLTS